MATPFRVAPSQALLPLHPPGVRPFLSSSRRSATTPFGEYDDVRILLVDELQNRAPATATAAADIQAENLHVLRLR
jgi:hypothetical protein